MNEQELMMYLAEKNNKLEEVKAQLYNTEIHKSVTNDAEKAEFRKAIVMLLDIVSVLVDKTNDAELRASFIDARKRFDTHNEKICAIKSKVDDSTQK